MKWWMGALTFFVLTFLVGFVTDMLGEFWHYLSRGHWRDDPSGLGENCRTCE